MAGFDWFDRQCIQHGEYLCREAFADLQNMAERLDCQDAWLAQRQIAQDGSDQILKLFVRRPARQREGFEPACELRVAVDGLACFSHAEAHERHLHLVAQEPQRVQNHALSRCEPHRMLWTSSITSTLICATLRRLIAFCSRSTIVARGLCGAPSAVRSCAYSRRSLGLPDI